MRGLPNTRDPLRPAARRPRACSASRWLAVFATTLFVRAVDPVIPRIADHFAMDLHTVALLATAFALPYAIMQPVLGRSPTRSARPG